MSLVATLTLAWAAVHTWVGVQNAAFFARRRVDHEYLAFAIMSFGFAVFSIGAAIVTGATSYAAGAIGIRIEYLGGPAVFGAFIAFSHEIVGRPRSRLVVGAIVWSVIGAVLDAAGLFADPWVPATSSAYLEPELSLFGIVWVAGASVALAATVYEISKASRVDGDARAVAVAAAIGASASAMDLSTHVFGLGLPYLKEHAAVVVSLLLSQMLASRFAGADAELVARTSELERAYAELATTRDAHVRRERINAVEELSAVIAHEVRNPLAVLKNAVSGLRRSRTKARPEDRSTLLDIVDEEADRLRLLAASLVAYAHPMEPAETRVEAHALVDAARASASGREGLEIVVERQSEAPPVLGDLALLCRAISSIVENAISAMPTGGQLTIRAARTSRTGGFWLLLSIADTGEGMDTLVREKAIAPFFTTRPSGIGLGLAIADRIVRVHGGRIRIDSRFGGGTTVTIELPEAPRAMRAGDES